MTTSKEGEQACSHRLVPVLVDGCGGANRGGQCDIGIVNVAAVVVAVVGEW